MEYDIPDSREVCAGRAGLAGQRTLRHLRALATHAEGTSVSMPDLTDQRQEILFEVLIEYRQRIQRAGETACPTLSGKTN